jgi:ABC transporter, ATP-binding domain/permease protein, lipid/multidrug/protein-type ABC exporter
LIEVTQNFSILQTSMVSAGRVFALIDQSNYEPVQADSELAIREGNIRFEHVCFSYDGVNQILDDISFSVKKGETIAFVGHTGSGKSSIINVLMRFYEFQSGRVLIDNVDIRNYSHQELRENMGLVLQEPFLYHGTIKSNIAMYQEISDEEVKAAAEFVDADAFIQELPQGYNSPVSERGSSFSTGQRQLLAFARTVASQPKILILDEATANIDSETETLVQNSLEKMRKGRTTIAIAHRLSTIQDANCIYVIDKGRIIENGTHEELLALGGTYHKMYSLQAGALS